MIRPLALTDRLNIDGATTSSSLVVIRSELSDYLYLVADCLTVVFHESDSLGLSDIDLLETANRYLDEARDSLIAAESVVGRLELPCRLAALHEIPDAATELSRRARLLEDAIY
ncbi:hypothetical protein GC176_28080 [bacterium]|nr:hypothetical protein [bacterium]